MENKLIALYGLEDNNIDISDIFIDTFIKDDKIIIPKEADFNKYFGDPCPGNVKKIFIKINETYYDINENRDKNDVEINLNGNNNMENNKIVSTDVFNSTSIYNNIIAYYGTEKNKINISKEFMRMFKKNTSIVIPMKTSFNECFGNPCVGENKNIFLKVNDTEYIINENHECTDLYHPCRNLVIDMESDVMASSENVLFKGGKVKIVYFVYINFEAQWEIIVKGQLEQLKKTGLLEISQLYSSGARTHFHGSELYIHIVCCDDDKLDMVINFIKDIVSDPIISTSNINQYEYCGIHLVWKLAKEHPEDIYLYFHSKGMVLSRTENGERSHHEQQIFKAVICPWKKVLNIFNDNPNINKVGFAISYEGWCWCNFWWARGTYLSECEEPIIDTDRWYYEYWLCKKLPNTTPSSYRECYGLADNNSNMYYGPGYARARENGIVLSI